MTRETQDQPTPSDELSSIAGRINGTKPGTWIVSADSFNRLLRDAKKLAGFVLRSDTQKGSNTRKRQTKKPANG